MGSLSIDKPRDFVGNREEKQKLEDIAGEDGSNVNNEAPPKSEEKEDLESNQPTRTNNTGDIDDKPIIPVDEIQFSFSPIDNYTSVMRFEDMNLREELLLGIYDVGFQCPSKIQEKALPLLLSSNHSNFIGQSQSGTGKTATFAIAALNRVDENMNHTQVVCISPSRELARQTMEFITLISKHTKITLGLAVRDSIDRNVQAIQDQVVVGTPGTLAGLVARRQLDVSHLKVFVVDEADHVLGEQNMGSQTLRVRKYV